VMAVPAAKRTELKEERALFAEGKSGRGRVPAGRPRGDRDKSD
jgi:hypothetical protein